MKEFDDIDNLFKESFEGFEVTPDPAIKAAIDQQISKSKRKVGLWLWMTPLIAAVFVLGLMMRNQSSREDVKLVKNKEQRTLNKVNSPNSDQNEGTKGRQELEDQKLNTTLNENTTQKNLEKFNSATSSQNKSGSKSSAAVSEINKTMGSKITRTTNQTRSNAGRSRGESNQKKKGNQTADPITEGLADPRYQIMDGNATPTSNGQGSTTQSPKSDDIKVAANELIVKEKPIEGIQDQPDLKKEGEMIKPVEASTLVPETQNLSPTEPEKLKSSTSWSIAALVGYERLFYKARNEEIGPLITFAESMLPTQEYTQLAGYATSAKLEVGKTFKDVYSISFGLGFQSALYKQSSTKDVTQFVPNVLDTTIPVTLTGQYVTTRYTGFREYIVNSLLVPVGFAYQFDMGEKFSGNVALMSQFAFTGRNNKDTIANFKSPTYRIVGFQLGLRPEIHYNFKRLSIFAYGSLGIALRPQVIWDSVNSRPWLVGGGLGLRFKF